MWAEPMACSVSMYIKRNTKETAYERILANSLSSITLVYLDAKILILIKFRRKEVGECGISDRVYHCFTKHTLEVQIEIDVSINLNDRKTHYITMV
jgi:hypothetical protein